jgi:hypothetical protein
VLPLTESADDINKVLSGLFNFMTGRKPQHAADPTKTTTDDYVNKEEEMGRAEADEAVDVDEVR